MKHFRQTLLPALTVMSLLFLSCRRGPSETVITAQPVADGQSDLVLDLREVDVIESHPDESYTFLKVREGDTEYWVATAVGTFDTGRTYLYNEAILKYGFRSKAMERVFDSIYLVTRLVPEAERSTLRQGRFNPHGLQQQAIAGMEEAPDPTSIVKVEIAELRSEPGQYADSWVEVSGVCTKVNPEIMGRNWVHLQDASGEGAEIVVTTGAPVKAGETVTFRALVRLDRDFGSGYRYDLILENGLLVR